MDIKKIGGIALSLGLLFGTVWLVSKAWKAGQTVKPAATTTA
jgi:hypothetical protein